MLVLLAVFTAGPLAVVALAPRLGIRVFYLAAAVCAAAFAHTLALAPQALEGSGAFETLPWIPQLEFALAVRLDALSWLLALIVTGVGALVLLFCLRYFSRDDATLGRFAATLLAFAGAMYGLVIADDVFLLYVFWEATTVFSYLLIGHRTSKKASRGAALQALLVTTFGGLAMLVGLVLLSIQAGTTALSELVASPPEGTMATVAVMLVLVGALTKSAIVPFHFWLPAAMAAPTPVSAYLHAAAMVKAGVYLVGRFAPGFADAPGWRVTLVALGVLGMLLGAYRALRQHDLKLLLAYGTVSQLGFLMVVIGFGSRDAALAALAMLSAHALFKAALFLVVGIIDHDAGTRDLRMLSGLGRRAPALALVAGLAAASMAGLPPFVGFVAKEAVFTAFLTEALAGSGLAWFALAGVALGSVLTVAYTGRFMWGAFARKADAEPGDGSRYALRATRPAEGEPAGRVAPEARIETAPSLRTRLAEGDTAGRVAPEARIETAPSRQSRLGTAPSFLAAPAVLAVAGLVLGPLAPFADPVLARYSSTLPVFANGVEGVPGEAYHLALWHGLEPALGISALVLLLGVGLHLLRDRVFAFQRRAALTRSASDAYWATMRGIDRTAVTTTAITQTGSLPSYLGVILAVLVVSVGSALVLGGPWHLDVIPWDRSAQLPVVAGMIIAAVAATVAQRRFQAAVLVGVTGYGVSGLFMLHGAPDLALTQLLVETVTLVALVLVLRRLPSRLGTKHGSARRGLRAVLAACVGTLMAVGATVALGSRIRPPVSVAFPELAVEGGHGLNIVNVTLVDIRGWDTMGELSVIVAAATGVASLVFLSSRADGQYREATWPRRRGLFGRMAAADRRTELTRSWLIAEGTMAPRERSILLEVAVRLIFHAIIVVSVYLLFAGHNAPGGGFSGGLVAGLAIVARYLAGGRIELGASTPFDAGKVLGAGILFAAGTAAVPLLFGVDALTSTWWEADVWPFGHISFVTSTLFDIGVYLVVLGLVLDVLRSLGAEVDRQREMEVAR